MYFHKYATISLRHGSIVLRSSLDNLHEMSRKDNVDCQRIIQLSVLRIIWKRPEKSYEKMSFHDDLHQKEGSTIRPMELKNEL